MNRIVANLALAVALAVLYSGHALLLAVPARLDDALFLPHVFLSLCVALTVGMALKIFVGKLPAFNWRVLPAALTLAFLGYVLAPLFFYTSLRVLPSGMVMLAWASPPLFTLWATTETRARWPFLLLGLASMVIFFLGMGPNPALRGATLPAFIFLLLGLASHMGAVILARRAFWWHGSLELGFWAALCAIPSHLMLALVAGEGFETVLRWPKAYWVFLLLSGLLVTGLGSLMYRVAAYRLGMVGGRWLAASIPIVALALGMAAWGETPANPITLASSIGLAAVLFWTADRAKPVWWLCHFLYNDIRQSDRLHCALKGFIRTEGGASHAVEVVDLSLGGFGFKSDTKLEVSSQVVVQLPFSDNWSQVSLDCQVVHVHPSSDPALPWMGGMRWRGMEGDKLHTVIEFLAKLSRPE